jgi:hypothetical protein
VTPLLAHGVEVRADLPIPTEFFVLGAALVLIASFAALTTLWTSPKLEDEDPGRPVLPLPPVVDVVLGAVGVALLGITIYAGLTGSDVPAQNLAPNMVYVGFWVGLVVASLLLGDVFRLLSPWRAIARAASWLGSRVSSAPPPAPVPYPEKLGRWPAAVGLLVFGWFELVASNGSDPRVVAILAIVYTAAMLVGMAVFGIEAWSRNADPFGVYFNLFARLSPWARRDGKLVLRKPAAGLRDLAGVAGTVALLCVAIGTTSFDGLTGGALWADIQDALVPFFDGLGLSYVRATELTYSLVTLACVGLIAAVYLIGVRGMQTVRGGRRARNLAERFAPSLVPIALAYVVAHYFSLLVFQGQSTVELAGNLAEGKVATPVPDYGVVSADAIWYVQVGVLVAGHAAGLALAHDKALAIYPSVKAATRSQLWMLLVMVAYTMLGLWLLSSAN